MSLQRDPSGTQGERIRRRRDSDAEDVHGGLLADAGIGAKREVVHMRRHAWPAEPRVAAEVRAMVGSAMRDWGLAPLTDDAVLCASELAANAIRHPVSCRPWWDELPARFMVVVKYWPSEAVTIAVEDCDPTPIHLPRPVGMEMHPDDVDPYADDLYPVVDDLAESNRGLAIVAATADFLSWSARPADLGKSVWCRFELARRGLVRPALTSAVT